jgi:hypothetical protein
MKNYISYIYKTSTLVNKFYVKLIHVQFEIGHDNYILLILIRYDYISLLQVGHV